MLDNGAVLCITYTEESFGKKTEGDDKRVLRIGSEMCLPDFIRAKR